MKDKHRPSAEASRNDNARRSRVSQADVPAYPLEQALRIPEAIGENYAFKPTSPLHVAEAASLSPQSSQFRMICGASIAYGLTIGGYNSAAIEVTPLGRRILSPTVDGDEVSAKREAALKPRVVREFLEHYDGKSFLVTRSPWKCPRPDGGAAGLRETNVRSDPRNCEDRWISSRNQRIALRQSRFHPLSRNGTRF